MANDPEPTNSETESELEKATSNAAAKSGGEGQPLPCGKDEIWDPVQQKCVPRPE